MESRHEMKWATSASVPHLPLHFLNGLNPIFKFAGGKSGLRQKFKFDGREKPPQIQTMSNCAKNGECQNLTSSESAVYHSSEYYNTRVKFRLPSSNGVYLFIFHLIQFSHRHGA